MRWEVITLPELNVPATDTFPPLSRIICPVVDASPLGRNVMAPAPADVAITRLADPQTRALFTVTLPPTTREPDRVPPDNGRNPPFVPLTNIQFPDPSDLKRITSPAFVTIFEPPGRAIAELFTIVSVAVKRHSLTKPATDVPNEVIGVPPVI